MKEAEILLYNVIGIHGAKYRVIRNQSKITQIRGIDAICTRVAIQNYSENNYHLSYGIESLDGDFNHINEHAVLAKNCSLEEAMSWVLEAELPIHCTFNLDQEL